MTRQVSSKRCRISEARVTIHSDQVLDWSSGLRFAIHHTCLNKVCAHRMLVTLTTPPLELLLYAHHYAHPRLGVPWRVSGHWVAWQNDVTTRNHQSGCSRAAPSTLSIGPAFVLFLFLRFS